MPINMVVPTVDLQSFAKDFGGKGDGRKRHAAGTLIHGHGRRVPARREGGSGDEGENVLSLPESGLAVWHPTLNASSPRPPKCLATGAPMCLLARPAQAVLLFLLAGRNTRGRCHLA